MGKKLKFFQRTVVGAVFVCVAVFVCLTIFMTYKSRESMVEVSDIYMSETNRQLRQKFSSIISLRLEQVEGVIRFTPPTDSELEEWQLEQLRTSAEVRNFTFLGLYSNTGMVETIYGDPLVEFEGENLLELLQNEDGDFVTNGTSETGERVLIIGKAAEYKMQNGEASVALLAALPMEYLNEALYLQIEDSMVYTHVIDIDGSYIIRNGDAFRRSYFDRLREGAKGYDGKSGEECVEELREAMLARVDYSDIIIEGKEQQHIYCSPIGQYSNWYLVTVMPNGVLEHSISSLDRLWLVSMFLSAAVILVMMSWIFIKYYKMSQQQMRELDAANREAVQASRAKSEFLSSMSHDIRTPMNAIVGMTEIALKNVGDALRLVDCLHKIQLSSKHLLGLINDVLDMSKIESGKMTLNNAPMSLRNAMDDIVNIIQPQIKERHQFFDIFINKVIAEEVYCDSVRLNQILLNLLSNAVKFTPEGGRVDVHVMQEPSPEGEGYVRTHFHVKDTGIGMSEAFQKKIFDTFTREDTQVSRIVGTGLGMAITKSIVDIMGGTIELQSKQGEGSHFHIALDLKKAETALESMELPGWNILVVDDNEQLCMSAASNLEELGVHAEWVTDGREAVRLVEEHHKKGENYHFVLVDWKMPGMDGVETIQKMRECVGEAVPIFLISSYDWDEMENEKIHADIEGFISKPLFKSTLYDHLKQYKEGDQEEIQEKEQKEVDFTGKHILLAEDIDLNWEVAYEILSTTGMELERAVNGKECLEKFKASEPGYYGAILMDIRMPVMNGYEAAKAIRALKREDSNLPIIAMTADAFSDDVQRCLESGMNAHIPKPIDVGECMRLLGGFLS